MCSGTKWTPELGWSDGKNKLCVTVKVESSKPLLHTGSAAEGPVCSPTPTPAGWPGSDPRSQETNAATHTKINFYSTNNSFTIYRRTHQRFSSYCDWLKVVWIESNTLADPGLLKLNISEVSNNYSAAKSSESFVFSGILMIPDNEDISEIMSQV